MLIMISSRAASLTLKYPQGALLTPSFVASVSFGLLVLVIDILPH